jgi:hypothetical protein
MAKKTQKFELDEFGFDAGLGTDDFDFDLGEVKDDRSPITKIGSGALEGAKSTVKDPEFARKLVTKALPRGYGAAINLADQTAGSLRNLYNESAKEIKPALNEMRRTTKRVLPQAEKVLPKAITERLKKWSEQAEAGSEALALNNQRDMSLQMQLGDIFQYNAEQEVEKKATDKIKEGIDGIRHRDTINIAEDSRVSLKRLADYQDKVTVNYQRKSLELQYRHYFVAQDTLEETKKILALSDAKLSGIMKNTGLPDFVKSRQSEYLRESMRNKFIGSFTDGLMDQRREFVTNVGKRISENVMNRVKSFGQGMRGGLDQANQMLDVKDMMGDMSNMPGMSKEEIGGSMAGGWGANKAGDYVGKKLGGILGKNEALVKGGNKAQYWVNNLPQIAGEWARNPYAEQPKWMPGFLADFLRDPINSALSGPDNALNVDRTSNLQEPAQYNRHANKSITEIIPGFLSRIYQELQIIRTGDAGTQLVTYDLTQNKFSKSAVAKKNAFNKLFNSYEKANTKEGIDGLMKEIDPKGKLTTEQRAILSRQLLEDNATHREGSSKRLTDWNSYTGESRQHAGAYSELFQEYFAGDRSGAKAVDFANKYNRLGDGLTDQRQAIQEMMNAGMGEAFYESGIVDQRTGRIDMKKLREYNLEGSYDPQTPDKSKRRRRVPLNTVATKAEPVSLLAETPAVADTSGREALQSNAELLAALRENNVTKTTETISETLLRIEDRLNKGISFGSTGFDGNGFQGGPSTAAKGPWWARSVGSLANGAVGTIGGAARFAKKTIGSTIGTAAKLTNGIVGGGFSALGKAGSWGFGKYQEFRDVYVEGEVKPRLLTWRLKAGEYRDQATGKVISSYKDIKGAVVDKAGNIIMTAEEAGKAFVQDGRVKRTLSMLGSAVKGVAGFAGGAVTGTVANLGTVYNFAWNMAKKAYNLLDEPEDVYIKGKPEPVLLARVMKAGGYRSRRTSKIIKSPSDIDGVIIDDQNNVMLSMEDLAKGMVNKYGKPLRTGLGKITGAVSDIGKAGVGLLLGGVKKIAGLVSGGVSGGMDFVKNLFGNVFSSEGLVFAGGKTMTDRLTEIRDILLERMPGKKRVWGDVDGDGVREGSYEDIKRKKKEAADKASSSPAAAAANSAAGGGESIYSKLKGLFSRKKDKDDEKSGGIDIDVSSDGKDRGRRGRKGRLGKLASKGGRLGRAASWGGSALRGAGSLALRGGAGLLGLGSLGAGLSTVASAATATGGALMTGAGWLATGLGAVGTAIGSVVSAPVLLGAAAVAAIGTAGYFGYKYLTKKTLTPLSTLRYLQYGFSEKDTDHLQTVFGLEDQLMKGVTYDGGIARLDDKKIDTKVAIESFDVDVKNPTEVERWMQWFALRFKPVFLTHLSVIKSIAADLTLDNIEKLKPDAKRQYVTMAKYLEGPYDVFTAPFKNMKSLYAGKAEVANYVEKLEKDLAKDTKEGKDATKSSGLTADKAAIAGATSLTAAAALTRQPDIAKAVGNGSNPMQAPAVTGSMSTVAGGFAGFARKTGGKIDGLTAIRFKAYGLSELVTEKVRALDGLEEAVLKYISFGSGGVATWKGDPEAVLASLGSSFGVEGVANNNAYTWLGWFHMRFLPVFTNYLTALKSLTGKDKPEYALLALKPQQAVDAATVLYSTRSSAEGFGASVWAISESPWPGYELNSDVNSIKDNLQALKEVAKKTVHDEAKGTKDSAGLGADNGAGNVSGGNTKSMWESTKETASKAWDSAKNMAGNIGSSVASGAAAAGSAIASGAKAAGSAIASGASAAYDGAKNAVGAVGSMIGGLAIAHPGKGTGGDINQLPTPQGNPGSGKSAFAPVKELISKAAKMAGVDEKLMATMAAIESGFNWTVKAGTSSATGLYQFIKGTWDTMLRKYGSKYGIAPGTPATDPRANALMGAEFLKENADALKSIGRPLTDTDLYIAHFMGAGGAKQFLSADPSAIAANLMPAAANANKSIFYDKGRPLTVGEVYQVINGRVRRKGKEFGLDEAGAAGAAVAGAAATTTTAPSTGSTATPSSGSAAMPAGNSTAGGGRGSVIPVSDQSATPSTAASGGGETPSRVDPQVASSSGGFSPSAGTPTLSERARDITAQSKVQRDAMSEVMGSVDTTLQKSLGVQTEQLEVLKRLFKFVQEGGSMTGAKGAAPAEEPTSSATMRSPRAPSNLTQAPVSMGKPVY